jgi:hypothetical protein
MRRRCSVNGPTRPDRGEVGELARCCIGGSVAIALVAGALCLACHADVPEYDAVRAGNRRRHIARSTAR